MLNIIVDVIVYGGLTFGAYLSFDMGFNDKDRFALGAGTVMSILVILKICAMIARV